MSNQTDPELLDLLHKKIPRWVESDEFPLSEFKQALPDPSQFAQDNYHLRYFLAYTPGQNIELTLAENTQARFHGWIEFVFQKNAPQNGQIPDWIFHSYQGFVSGKPFSGKVVPV